MSFAGVRRWATITALAGLTLPAVVDARIDELGPGSRAAAEVAAATSTTTRPSSTGPAPAVTTTTTDDGAWLGAVVEPPAVVQGADQRPDEIARALPGESAPAAPTTTTTSAPLVATPVASTRIIVPAHREQYRPILVRYAQANGLPADLVMALAWKESSWRPGAVSGAGAVGMMQLMPDTVTFASRNLMGLKTNLDPRNATSNIRMATRFLKHLVDHFKGDYRQALIAYNQGITSLKKRGAYGEASGFADTVLRLRASFPAPRVLK